MARGWCQRCNEKVGLSDFKLGGTIVHWQCGVCLQRYKYELKGRTLKEVGIDLIPEEDQPPIDSRWTADEVLDMVEDIANIDQFTPKW